MAKFYVVGGRQKPGVDESVEEWHHYSAGLVLEVDSDTGEMIRRVEYISPPEVCAADDPSILFKTATIEGSRMYVPTQTEVLIYELPSFEQVGYISLPLFNDVHHVRPAPDGTLLIANTGLDMVLAVREDGTVVREWNAIDEDTWSRFSRDEDYRTWVTTKPHHSHPNNVFLLDGEVWVSRCNQRDARCLTADLEPIPIADKYIHDGVVHGDSIYFTAVDGQVVVVDRHTRSVRGRYDLNAIAGGKTPLGWCRGLEVMPDGRVVVGFSRLRQTRWKENVHWVKHRLGGDGLGLLPTRIAFFDLEAGRMDEQVNLEPAGMNAVFSVHRIA